jgi:hypothetical protein
MVTLTAKLLDRPASAQVHGPQDVRGDAMLIATAGNLLNRGVQVEATPLLGGGRVSFEHERIAAATLAEVCDPGIVQVVGVDAPVPVGAVA